MKVICVDDALPIIEDIAEMCRKLPRVDEAFGFTRPKEAMEWIRGNPVDIALLDIDMPEISGLMLAEELQRVQPDAVVILLTAFPQFAPDASSCTSRVTCSSQLRSRTFGAKSTTRPHVCASGLGATSSCRRSAGSRCW